MLTKRYVHEIERKEKKIYHPVTYLSGLFRGSQLNWATLTKEAYAIYMYVKKLDYYLAGAQTTLRSDYLPLKKFLKQRTGNSKVNNWALCLEEYAITFEFIKGIKNTLADAMSRLVHIDPSSQLEPEPEGFKFGELKVDEEDLDEVEVQSGEKQPTKEKSEKGKFQITVKDDDKEPIPEIQLGWNMSDKDIAKIQRQDEFCNKTIEEIQKRKRETPDKYHKCNGLNDLLRPHIRYLGTDESILSLQAMRNIYKMVAHNLKTPCKRLEKEATKFPTRVKSEDLIMLKRHDKKTFEPVYEGYYQILKTRGNQIDVQSISGDQVKMVHIKDVKVILPVDRVINEMPDYTKFGRKSKLELDPTKIPNLNWVLSTKIHTHTVPTTTVSMPSQTVDSTLIEMPILSSITSMNITN